MCPIFISNWCSQTIFEGIFRVIKTFKNKKQIVDPFVKKEELKKETKKDYNIMKNLKPSNYDCIIIAVGHTFYKKMGIKKIKRLSNKKNCLFFDLKSLFKKDTVDFQL